MTQKFGLPALLILLTLLLSACTLGQAPAATPTPQDISAVYTRAAETARAELTQIASLSSPTLEPTATQPPTATIAPLTQVTPDASGATATLLPTPILVLEFTATPAGGGLPPAPGLETPTLIPSITPVSQGGGSAGPVCKNSAFLADVTIPDGTILKPGDNFIKTWQMQNTGTCTWDDGFSFLPWAGPTELTQDNYRIRLDASKFVAPGAIIEISLELKAPSQPGEYIAHYAWFDDVGKPFGGDFVVYIVVQ